MFNITKILIGIMLSLLSMSVFADLQIKNDSCWAPGHSAPTVKVHVWGESGCRVQNWSGGIDGGDTNWRFIPKAETATAIVSTESSCKAVHWYVEAEGIVGGKHFDDGSTVTCTQARVGAPCQCQ